ncbi:hypothetical protein GGS26DRAFT_555158 [Hypomontagnella submonticulosa]|nr:hypothetical protein GGS26DRAFT_555158 [Hypomontagnella submonticulosa]
MPARKRTAAEAIPSEITGSSRRRSHRISSSGKKSSYFEANDNDDDNDELGGGQPPRKTAKTQSRASLSGQKRNKKEVDELQDEDDEEAFEDAEEDGGFVEDKDESDDGSESEVIPPPTQKRGRGRPSKSQAGSAAITKKSAGKSRASDVGMGKPLGKPKSKAKPKKKAESEEPEADEYAEGEDDDDDDDDDEDRITFIPAIKLRDTDGVDYEDTRLHKNTLLFLKDLKANNKRSWLKAHDKEYRRSLKDWESFVTTLTEKIVEADETIPELPIKDVVFRIYRDIRFSKDPTPYKPHYSAAWSRTGRKGPYACYYVHAEPGRCMVGGGLWHPAADALARLRANIDERPHRIRRVLMNPTFRKTFLPNAKPNEKAVLSAFAKTRMNQENALKTKPKGFTPDHRDIELLKLRNYTIGTYIEDADLVAEDAQERVMGIISAMVEFVTYLNNVVMPDPGFDSDSDDADDGEEGQDEQQGEDEGTEEEKGESSDDL